MKILEKDCKARNRKAERDLGISSEYREMDWIMEDYLERRDEEEAKKSKESAEDRNKEDQDKSSGEEMRNGMGEPRKKVAQKQ